MLRQELAAQAAARRLCAACGAEPGAPTGVLVVSLTQIPMHTPQGPAQVTVSGRVERGS